MKLLKIGLFALSFAIVWGCGQSEQSVPIEQLNFADENGGITLPDGFQATVVADSIGRARHIAIDDDGDIYVALDNPKNGGGIVALRDEDNDGNADTREYFGELTGTGIHIHNGYLYFGSDTSVVRYPLNGNELVPSSEPEPVISNFPDQGSHAAKSLAFDQSGNIYVNIGAPSNACQEKSRTPESPGMDPCPQLEHHGGIWQFDANTTGQVFPEDGQRYATGIRNAVALEWNDNANQLYVVQHGRDQLNTLWPEHYDVQDNAELPAEEFFQVNEGDNFGWPYTYYDWQKEQKMVGPEYGGDGETPVEEGQYEDPVMAFPGHWAPNDLIFYNGSHFPDDYRNGALIAFHGSWNRAPEPQKGYKVVFVPFNQDKPAGDYQDFADGFSGADTLRSPGDAEYRPMGLAMNKDGTLYITDSVRGKIWRVVYVGTEPEA